MSLSSLRRTTLTLMALVLFAMCGANAHAADVNARIKGTVTDPTGAVIPGATVIATNIATGVKYPTTSQKDGGYFFAQLPIGTYSISVSAHGFKSFTATGIILNIDQEYVEAVKLSLGSATETLEVAADPVQVNTTDMQLNNIVDAKEIVEYPLLGRSFTQLELLLPGVQASSDRFGSNYSVNGSQTQQSSYLINGADVNDFALNTIGIQPNVDALDQFNLITGPLNAEYSRNSGAIVSAVYKSGTNQFHGDAFEFYRDTFLNNKNFFQTSAPVYHQNTFGGTLGGPILKDKLFFFAAYQGNRARQPQATSPVQVPTANQRTGNFSGSTFSATDLKHFIPGTISIPGCISNAGGNTPGADTFGSCLTKLNYNIPTTAFNSISAKLLSAYVPQANVNNTYVFNAVTKAVQNQYVGKIDYNLTSKDQIGFIFTYQHAPTIDTLPFTGANLPGFGDQNTSEIRQMTATYTRQLSSTTLNSFALHYTRFNFGSVTPQNVVLPSTLGFAITPQDAAGASVPYIGLTGGFSLGFSTNGPQPRIDQNYQVDDSISKIFGKHSIKVGYDGRRFNVDNEFDARNNGSYSFSTSNANNPNSSGNVFLDYLLGIPASYGQTANGRISVQAYEDYLFGQDTWKVTPSLTIDYGIGWQIDTANQNRQYGGQGVNCFIPGQQSKIFPTAPLSLNFPGDPGCNSAQGAVTHYNDVGPRIGFAYSPNLGFLSGGDGHKLSIRGGFGIYYNRTEEEGSLQNLSQVPFGISSAGIRDVQTGLNDRPAFANPYQNINTGATITNPFPASFPKPGATNVTFSGNPLYLSGYSPTYRDPYAENFQLTVEREFPSQIVLTASYVGSVGRHNQNTIEGNPVTTAGHAACVADANCVANQGDQEILYPSHTQYPQPINPATGATHFYSASQIATGASSNYNSLQLSAKKGPTHGLGFQVSYTYSHALDSASSYEGAGFGGERGYNQYQPSLNYGNSDYDTRNRLVIAPIYQVPYKSTGGPFSLINLLGAGWEVSAITTFAQGHPFDISYQGGESYALYCSANDFYYTCPDIPNQIAPLHKFNPHKLNNSVPNSGGPVQGLFFDGNVIANSATASLADENYIANGVFGNISRNKYYGPGIDNTNIQISKSFRYSGNDSNRFIQLRLESFNVFNHTNFNNPNGNPDNGPNIAGVISSAAAGRQTQLSGKIYF